ncbi:MAG: hypothetical protein VX777_01375 [Chlamydiota bacterium]|nr:hypothetical protein [Chlamydiota bacterium]
MGEFIKELESGEIQLRDKWQLELKSEFFQQPDVEKNTYTQEFFIFVPNSLNINKQTYTKDNFYQDQTNFIRFKTPVFSLDEINDNQNKQSPIFKILELSRESNCDESQHEIQDELKLLGNVVRSSLRRRVLLLIKIIKSDNFEQHHPHFHKEVELLNEQLACFRANYHKIRKAFFEKGQDCSLVIKQHILHVDEFISTYIDYFLSGLLKELRTRINDRDCESDNLLCTIIIAEAKHRSSLAVEPNHTEDDPEKNEFIFYRAGLLKKFVLDALLLNTSRSSPANRLNNVIGSFAAGIAMLVYFVLFIWQGTVFLINSEPFVLTTVVLYILKDRLKESLKTISYRVAFRWFSDFTTKIKSPDETRFLGKLKESFSFLSPEQLPKEIIETRNKEFHNILEDFQRPERVMYYKKNIQLKKRSRISKSRRYDLNMIFRFNIHRFIRKADNAYQNYLKLNPSTMDFTNFRLPKVYHVNIIMKNTYVDENGAKKSELKKFRLILDKNGIKRLENV